MVQRFIYKGNYNQRGGSLGGILASIARGLIPALSRGVKSVAASPITRKALKSAGKQLAQSGPKIIGAALKGETVSPVAKRELKVAKKRVSDAVFKSGCPPSKKPKQVGARKKIRSRVKKSSLFD